MITQLIWFPCVFQAEYNQFTELKEGIVREVEEATRRGELVVSARRFVEELSNARVPYERKCSTSLSKSDLLKQRRRLTGLGGQQKSRMTSEELDSEPGPSAERPSDRGTGES